MSRDAEADEILVRSARGGDSGAFVKFSTRWWPPVYRIALNMLGSQSEAAEAAGRVLLLALRFPDAAGGEAPFAVSLYGMAIDVTLLRRPRVSQPPIDLAPRFDWCDSASDLSRRPGLAEAIRQMLQQLDRLDRAVFVLRELEGFALDETVAVLRLPEEEVRARGHRAVVQIACLIRQMLEGEQIRRTNL